MAGNKFQIKRTGVSGRQPNTTSSSNSAYIDVGELALNFADQILYTSDGNTAIELGANVTNQNITGTLSANGSVGSEGQVLTSNGSGIYWGSGGSWIEKTSDYTAVTGDRILTDTSANTFTITLPATPSVGDVVELVDGSDWAVNNLIVARNGSTIEGGTDDLVLDVGNISVRFLYGGTPETWQVITGVGPQGPIGPPGVVLSNTAPSNTELLWADTSEEGAAVLPVGGTTGQYLVKASNGDYDSTWVTLETDLTAVESNIVPASSNTYDLGTSSNTWRDLYLSGNTIFLGNTTITETDWSDVREGVLGSANTTITADWDFTGSLTQNSANVVTVDETNKISKTLLPALGSIPFFDAAGTLTDILLTEDNQIPFFDTVGSENNISLVVT